MQHIVTGSVATASQEVPAKGRTKSNRGATAAENAQAKETVSVDEGATAASRRPARAQALVERFGATSLGSQGKCRGGYSGNTYTDTLVYFSSYNPNNIIVSTS